MIGKLVLNGREPTAGEAEAVRIFLETGGVPKKYLDKVLGDQSRGVCVTSNSYYPEADRKRQEFADTMGRLGPAQWVFDMQRHFEEYGFYRPEDLRRLLGDPMTGVEWSEEGMREILLGRVENNSN